MRVSAILTAAGESVRMGRPKPLLPWPDGSGSDVPLVTYQISQLMEAGVDEIVVVLGHRAEEVVPQVKAAGARHVVNPDYRDGKTTSIKAGLREIDPDAEAVVLLAVDQPRPAGIIRRVIEAHRDGDAAVTLPSYGGRGGHPIVFGAGLILELKKITEETRGIRRVVEKHQADVQRVEIDDARIRLDLNTPEEYEEGYDLLKGAASED